MLFASSRKAHQLASAIRQGSRMCNSSSGSLHSLPPNVAILTIEKQPLNTHGEYTVLLRVAHKFGVGEHGTLSQPATVSLARLFKVRKKKESERNAGSDNERQ